MIEDTTALRVLGISGSLRRGSYNTALIRAAAEVAPDDVTIHLASIADIPLYDRDVEREHGFPDAVVRLRSEVAAADALLVATPEYNYSVPGVLKNAWDWLSRKPDSPIAGMPAAVMGAGGRLGTARAQQHFRDIARHDDLRVIQKPEVLIADAWSKFDDEGRLVDDRARDQVARLVAALRSLARREARSRRRVLVVGGDDAVVRRALVLLSEAGHAVAGTVVDGDAMPPLEERGVDLAVAIGIEAGPLGRLGAALGLDRGVPIIEADPTSVAQSVEAALQDPGFERADPG